MFRVFLIFLLILIMANPGLAEDVLSRQTTDYFATVSALTLYNVYGDTFLDIWTDVKSLLNEIEQAVSVTVDTSDISRFNQLKAGESCEISPITAEILTAAKEVYAVTEGLFDPTVYPLVDLWGFTPRFNQGRYHPVQPYDREYVNGALPLPDPTHITALSGLVGFDGVTLLRTDHGWALRKDIEAITIDGVCIQAKLDLGGIAKGYACDRVRELLTSRGITQGHFICGGSSMALLSRPTPDGLYSLTIGKPRPGSTAESHYATFFTRDRMLSSSADNLHRFVQDSVVYCHLIDPRTGWPINMPAGDGMPQQGIAALTLLSDNATTSDAFSTALCVMGPRRAADFISKHLQDTMAVMACFRQGESTYEVITNARPHTLRVDDPAYVISSEVDAAGQITYTGSYFAH